MVGYHVGIVERSSLPRVKLHHLMKHQESSFMSTVHPDAPDSNRRSTGRLPLASSVMALAVWCMTASTVHAQNPYTWNNGTTTSFTGDWNVAGNWRDAGNGPGVPPSSATTQL